MKKLVSLVLALIMLLSVCSTALAVNEDVEGEVLIYSSMYPFVIDMMDAAIKEEFPNLVKKHHGYCLDIVPALIYERYRKGSESGYRHQEILIKGLEINDAMNGLP